jgi:hypothetical protein
MGFMGFVLQYLIVSITIISSSTGLASNIRFTDKQIVRLQETPDEIPEGGTPHTVSLLMHDKLVDAGKPGDRIEVRPYCNMLIPKRILTYIYFFFFFLYLMNDFLSLH